MANRCFQIGFLFSIFCFVGLSACKKDTSARDKFIGTYIGQRICSNPSFLTDDTSEVTITIQTLEWTIDSVEIVLNGATVDSTFATQKAGFGGNVLVFSNTHFAGELNDSGDSLTIHDVALGYPCVSSAIRQ